MTSYRCHKSTLFVINFIYTYTLFDNTEMSQEEKRGIIDQYKPLRYTNHLSTNYDIKFFHNSFAYETFACI